MDREVCRAQKVNWRFAGEFVLYSAAVVSHRGYHPASLSVAKKTRLGMLQVEALMRSNFNSRDTPALSQRPSHNSLQVRMQQRLHSRRPPIRIKHKQRLDEIQQIVRNRRVWNVLQLRSPVLSTNQLHTPKRV